MTTNPKHHRSAGAVALRRTGLSQVAIGQRLGRSKQAVGQWLNDGKMPSDEMLGRIKEEWGIEPEAWRQPAAVPSSESVGTTLSPPAKRDEDAAVAGGAFGMARALQRELQAQIDDLEMHGPGWAPSERAQVGVRLASAVEKLAKLTGEYDLARRLASLPSFQRFIADLFEAARDFPPEVSEKLAKRFHDLHERWLRSVG